MVDQTANVLRSLIFANQRQPGVRRQRFVRGRQRERQHRL